MKSKFFAFFYFVTALVCFNHYSFAQKEYQKEALDSVIAPGEDADQCGYADTVLKKNIVDFQNDSLQRWKRSREFAYMNYLDSLLKKKFDLKTDTGIIDQNTGKIKRVSRSSDNSRINKWLNSLPLKAFFWVLAILFIGLIFYKIFFKNGIFERIKNKNIETDIEDTSMGLRPLSEYDALVLESEGQNNFNLSIRYLYLQTLKSLSEKGFIHFLPDKTNNEYINEIASDQQQQLASLTRNYEFVWYGEFLIDKAQYQQLKSEFIDFNKRILN